MTLQNTKSRKFDYFYDINNEQKIGGFSSSGVSGNAMTTAQT
jgi:hypothetical protein